MLYKLILRDFLLNKKIILLFLIEGFAFFIWNYLTLRLGGVIIGVCCLFLSLPAFGVISREDKFKATATGLSLPVSRDSVVLTKYILFWVSAFAGLICMIFLVIIIPSTVFPKGSLLTLNNLFTIFIVLSVIISVLMETVA